jgi:hypothetical protein
MNIEEDKDVRLVFECWLVVSLVSGIPHSIVIVTGPEGCGKSIMMKVVRTLIDPSRIPLLSFNYDRHETALMLHQHYAPFFDNISAIPHWLSDVLCKASTGEAFTKRQLWTDEDSII